MSRKRKKKNNNADDDFYFYLFFQIFIFTLYFENQCCQGISAKLYTFCVWFRIACFSVSGGINLMGLNFPQNVAFYYV